MNYIKLQEVVEKEFDKEIATLVIAATAIHLSMKIKDTDLLEQGRFAKRREKKIKDTLWQHADKLDLVIQIIDAYYKFEIGESFQGLGGCVAKPLKEYIKRELRQ